MTSTDTHNRGYTSPDQRLLPQEGPGQIEAASLAHILSYGIVREKGETLDREYQLLKLKQVRILSTCDSACLEAGVSCTCLASLPCGLSEAVCEATALYSVFGKGWLFL